MNVLAIGAHPDDIEMGCFGALINHLEEGDEVSILVMTFGEKGGDADVRTGEHISSCHHAGFHNLYWGCVADTGITTDATLVNLVRSYVDGCNADVAYIPYAEDTHGDHRNLSRLCLPATRPVRNVLCYEGPSSIGFTPTVFREITKPQLKTKLESLKCHESQVQSYYLGGHQTLIDFTRNIAYRRGMQARVNLAEGFVPFRCLL